MYQNRDESADENTSQHLTPCSIKPVSQLGSEKDLLGGENDQESK
jgi:hypothetical protein